jgi:hypothetical protein
MSERIREQKELELSATKEEKRFLEAEKNVKRLARKAGENKWIQEVAQFDREHLKRELKANELSSFIETMEERLYLEALELAVGEGEKQEIGILHKSGIVLNATGKKDQEAKLDRMSFKERSFDKTWKGLREVDSADGTVREAKPVGDS